MDLSTVLRHHFHQELGSQSDSQTLETLITSSKPSQQQQQQQLQDPKKPRPPENEPQKCPRCDSANTKFCYYNNYSLSQPRYFCKSCRRYWTKGGTLRNVPVGGGCRRNKRPSSSSSVSSPSSTPSFSATSFLKRPHTHDVSGPNALFGGGGMGLGLGFGFDNTPQVNVTDFDGFLGHPHHNAGFLMSSVEQPNLGYGFGARNEEMGGVPFEAAMKQESFENRGLWGLYPWQQMINNNNNSYNIGDNHGLISSMGFGGLSGANDLEPIRGLIGNSAWQGSLLPSPALI